MNNQPENELSDDDDSAWDVFRKIPRNSAIMAADELSKNLMILYKLIPSMTDHKMSMLSEKCAKNIYGWHDR